MAQGKHEQSVSAFKQKLRIPLDSLYLCLAFTLESSLDNFRAPSRDVELIAGTLEIVLCYPCMLMKFYMLVANLLPAMAFMPPNILIFTDTGAAILACYVLLLDINWSFIWVAIFPIMAIIFTWALSQLYCSQGEDHEEATSNTVELEFIAIITFGALWAMDELLLDEHATKKFTISQFLLFLSFMLAALTCMMMRLPTDLFPGITPASELLHQTLLVLLLVTAHTVAAEALGEEVVLLCMPEVIPAVLIWFSIQHGSISGNMLKRYKKLRIPLGALVALSLAIMGESLSHGWCTTILLHCALSGLLAHYVVFMLSHWPGQQPADKPNAGKLAVELLKCWANDLLIAAAASLLLRYLLVSGLGWREALDALCQIFERLNSALKAQTNTFWSIIPLVGSALYNLWCISKAGITKLQKSFLSLFLVLHMCCFTDDVSRTVYKYNSIALLWKGMQRILVK